MFDESGYFDPTHDPNAIGGSLLDGPPAETCSSNNNNSSSSLDDKLKLHAFSLEELSNQHISTSTMGLDHLHHQLGFDLEQDFHGHLMQETVAAVDNWNPNLQDIHDGATHDLDLHLPQYGAAAAAPDLLNLLHLPRCAVSPPVLPPAPALAFNSPGRRAGNFPVDICGGELHGPDDGSAALYETSVQLGYPAPPAHHLLRDLFHTLPPNCGLFYGVDEREAAAAAAADAVGGGMVGGGVLFAEGEGEQFEDAVFEFRSDACRVEGKENYTTEKQRREQLGEKYKLLKSLVPNPTKNDRASTISDAIDYINELKRTIAELTVLVDTKKNGWNKKRNREDNAAADVDSASMRPLRDDTEHPFSGTLRSSWIQRRAKETILDVRIVDDEVTIKVTRRKKANCLLSASKAIEELQLDLVHVSGGHIGDSYIFMFNTKISQGSYVYASAVAKKLLEAMDRPCPTLPIRF